MSNLTANDVNGLMEAYSAVYDPDLREELEEDREVEEVGLQIIENAAYVLFSQGYTVDDLIDYFSEADNEVITEDAMAISEGVLLVESVAVSDEYIAEQFEILYEGVGSFLLKQGGKLAQGAAKLLSGGGKKVEAIARAKNIQNIKNAKTAVPPGSAKVTTGAGGKPPTGTAKVTTSGGQTVGRNLFQRAGDWAKGVMKKIPGAGTVAKIAKGPVGKIAGKALPGVGAALYGMDAANRFKKGDWGGGLLSTAGAATSLIPGAGLVAGLAPAGVQMATDALGLTGDKSRKGGAPKAPGKPPSLKAKQDYAASKGKYYSSSDQKTYGNYNDAVAARNSRRGVKPSSPTAAKPAPAAPTTSPAPSGRSEAPSTTTAAKPAPKAPSKPTSTATKDTPMQQWAKANPSLASKVKVGQSGYDEISQMRDKPGPNEKQDQTPTQGPNTTPKQDADFAKQAAQATAEMQKREQEKLKQQQRQPVNASYEYDAFDLVLEYLTSEGHVDTLDEALYVMMEMDAETIQNICEAAADQSDKQIDKGVKTTYKAGNVIDNQHQGRSRGLNRLPANERAAKTKRIQGRLKARRDDLFGERNRREDEKREKLKKLLGL